MAIVYEAPRNVQRLARKSVDYLNLIEMGNNLKSILYLTVNTVNNKIYIGIHITNKPYEFDGYYGCGISGSSSYWFKHPKYPLQKAIKKYGFNAFKRYTLFVFDNYDDARDMERIIVNEEFVKRPDTYNVAIGGGCGLVPSTEIEIHRYDLEGNYTESYRSYSYASREFNISISNIRSAILYKKPLLNSFWSELKVANLDSSYSNKSQNKKVYVYDINGFYIEEYNSLSDYAKKYDLCLSSVQRAIKHRSKSCGNYLSLEKVDKFEIITKKRIRNRKVYQYDLDGNFIQEYENSSVLKPILNNDYNHFHARVYNGESCGGYLWSFEKVDKMKPLIKSRKKSIAQYDLDGNLIKIWDSYRSCVKEFSNAGDVLKGVRKHAKGFIFKYYE